jgi:hypothetical protein
MIKKQSYLNQSVDKAWVKRNFRLMIEQKL